MPKSYPTGMGRRLGDLPRADAARAARAAAKPQRGGKRIIHEDAAKVLGDETITPTCDYCGRRRTRDMTKPCAICGEMPPA